MKRVLVAALGLFAVLAPERARADVSLGANFGAGVVIPRRSDTHLVVGWPYSSLANLPGIRVGFELGSPGKHELYLDTTGWSQDSFKITYALLLVAYQHNFTPLEKNTFYFTAGGGPIMSFNHGDDYVTLMGGGGVGFRQRVSGGHGTIREELRADFIGGSEFSERKFVLSLKFGFDLWFR